MAGVILAAQTAFTAFAGSAVGKFLTGNILGRLITGTVASALSAALTQRRASSGLQRPRTTNGAIQPTSFIAGWAASAGHEVYPANTWGSSKLWLTYVLDFGDRPAGALDAIAIDNEPTAFDWGNPHPDYGAPAIGRLAGHAWVKHLDGTQTTADAYLLAKYGADPDIPFTADMVGIGLPILIFTFLANTELWRGLPVVRASGFANAFYDLRKDSTAGGSGTHLWNNPATWETTRNPAVILYNLRRGITVGGEPYGGGYSAAALPADVWTTAMNVCDQIVTTPAGPEPQFRTGIEITTDVAPIEWEGELLKACQGRIVEAGGTVLIRVGPPGLPVAFVTDADLVVTEGEENTPFPGPAEIWNGVEATFPRPALNWEPSPAPPYENATYLAEDRGRKRNAGLTLPAVPFAHQVQRQMRAWLDDSRRFRRHVVTLGPAAMGLMPFDVVAWTSAPRGYAGKLFEVASVALRPQSLDPRVGLRETDPDDFVPPEDTIPEIPVSVILRTPAAQVLPGYDLLAFAASDGTSDRRPALRHVWTYDATTMADATSIDVETRLSATGDVVAQSTLHLTSNTLRVAPDPLHATAYEGRARLNIRGRPTEWTAWRPATTPDVRLAAADLSDALQGDIAAGVEGRDLAVRAAVAGWVSDPIGARWSGAGTLDPAYWTTEDAAGVLSQAAGPTGAGITIAVPPGGGRSTALLPVLAGADPKATMVTVNLDVTFSAGDPFVPAAAVEWWTGAQWLPGELVTDGWGPQLLPGAVGVYDFANMASMWQDDAGTVPAVVDQPVARVTDLAGLRTLKQTSAAQRPTLRLTAGRLALQWDGGDLLFADNSAWGTDAVTVAAAYLKETQTLGSLVNWGSDPVSGNGTWEIQSSGSGALGDVFSTRGTARVPLISNSPAVPVSQILTMTADISTPVVTARRNGVQVATSGASQGAGNYGTALLRVGSRANGSQRLDAHVYALALFNRVLSPDELVQVEAWLSRRASPAGTFAALGIVVAAGVRQPHAWTVRRPATADNTTPPRLRLTAANPLITTAQTLTIHRLDVRGTTQAEVDARQALLDAAAASTAAAGALAAAPIVVASLPATGTFTGQLAYLTTDAKLYRWTGAAWSRAVDGNDLIADSVIAGKVAAAVIGARELAVGSFTASKGVITDQTNLVPDDQLQDAAAWTNSAKFMVIPSSSAGALVNSAGEIRYVGALPVVSAVVVDSLPFSVVPGEEFRCSGQIGRINGTSYTARATIRFETLDGSSGVTVNIGSAVTTTSSAIQTVSGVVVAPTSPAGLLRARFRWVIDSADGNVRFFAPVVRRRFGGELIVDGGIKAQQADLVSLGAAEAWVGTLTVGNTAITESDQESYGSLTLTIGGTTSTLVTQDVTIDGPTTRADVRLAFAMGAFTAGLTWTVNIESPVGTVRKSVSGTTKQEFVNIASEITLAAGPRTIVYRFSISGPSGSVTFNAREGFVGQFKR